MSIEYAQFDRSTQLDEQRKLFLQCFPETTGLEDSSKKHYNWKFTSCPVGETPSIEYCALMNGRLVGYYAAIPYKYRIAGVERTAAMVCDVMTAPSTRGKGVFTKLGSYATEQMEAAGLDFTSGYPVRPEVMPGHLKVGWSIVATMPVYVKLLACRSLLKKFRLGLVAGLANWMLGSVHKINDLCSSSTTKVEALEPNEVLESSWYDGFYEAWAGSKVNVLIKSKSFLRWRLSAPGAKYKIFISRTPAGSVTGMCIGRLTELKGIRTLAILDIMMLAGHERNFRCIDRSLITYARASGAEAIATMIAPHLASAYFLRSRLYLKSGHVFSLIIKNLTRIIPDKVLVNAINWHVMWLDSDDL